MLTSVDLARFYTKQLLNALRSTHAHDENTERIIDEIRMEREGIPNTTEAFVKERVEIEKRVIVEAYLLGYPYDAQSQVTIADLKAELAKREHVPNKQESKVIRQTRARSGRNVGRTTDTKPRRRHSRDVVIRCDLCSPLRCSKAR